MAKSTWVENEQGHNSRLPRSAIIENAMDWRYSEVREFNRNLFQAMCSSEQSKIFCHGAEIRKIWGFEGGPPID